MRARRRTSRKRHASDNVTASPHAPRHDYSAYLKYEPRIGIAIWFLLTPAVAVGAYLLRGEWPSIGVLGALAALCAPMILIGIFWSDRNRRRRLRWVTPTEGGLEFGPGVNEGRELLRWEEIDSIVPFDHHEARFVDRTPGLRIEAGQRVFWVYQCVRDFDRLLVAIEGHWKSR